MQIGISLSLSAMRGGGVTYYVSAAGNDSNNGLTAATAWATLGKANVPAPVALRPGDRVLIEGGQTFAGKLIAHAGVVYDSYGTGRATVTPVAADKGFYAHNMGARVRNLIFTGAGITTSTNKGVHFFNDLAGDVKIPGVECFNLTISGFGDDGLLIEGGAGVSGYASPLVNGVIAHHCTGNANTPNAGIRLGSDAGYGLAGGCIISPHITLSKAYNCTGKAGGSNWSGSGIVGLQCRSGLIDFCEAYENGANSTSSGGGGPVGMWWADSRDCVGRYSESHHNHTGAGTVDGGGFDLDGDSIRCTFEYCYSHDNDGPGYLVYAYPDPGYMEGNADNTVRYCISENDGAAHASGASVYIANDLVQTGTKVYGNTFYNSVAPVVRLRSENPGFFANNILFAVNQPLVVCTGAPTSLLFRGNCYHAVGTFAITWNSVTYNDVATWRAATGQETEGGLNTALSVDPLLGSPGSTINLGTAFATIDLFAYQLQTASPMLGAGQDLTALYGEALPAADFYGNAVVSWGVGAAMALMPKPAWVGSATDAFDPDGDRAYLLGVVFTSTATLYDADRRCFGLLNTRLCNQAYAGVVTFIPRAGGLEVVVLQTALVYGGGIGGADIGVGADGVAFVSDYNSDYNPAGTATFDVANKVAWQLIPGSRSYTASLNGAAVATNVLAGASARSFSRLGSYLDGGGVSLNNGEVLRVDFYPNGQSDAALRALAA